MPFFTVLAAASVMAASSPTTAPPVSSPAIADHGGTNIPSSVKDPDRKICREEEETGSHFSTRVCHTAAQWDAMTADAQTFTTRLESRQGCGPGGCGH